MAEFPCLPLWTDAYLADTGHLSTLEHGAYLLLLMTMWRSKEKSLPNDDETLRRIVRMPAPQWNKIKNTLMKFFHIEGDAIMQRRLLDEWSYTQKNSRRQSNNSRLRWLKTKETGDAMGLPRESHSPATSIPPTLPYPIKTSLQKNDQGAAYDVLFHLSENGRDKARDVAQGWDIQYLANVFNGNINDPYSGMQIPDFPDAAFVAWCKKYVQPKEKSQ